MSAVNCNTEIQKRDTEKKTASDTQCTGIRVMSTDRGKPLFIELNLELNLIDKENLV